MARDSQNSENKKNDPKKTDPKNGAEDYYRWVRDLAKKLPVVLMESLVEELNRQLKNKKDREEFLRRMIDHAPEFKKWLKKREARKIRKTGGDADGYWKHRRSETEEDSEDEDQAKLRERLFRLYWIEKHQYPHIFSRTMNEYLSDDEGDTDESEKSDDLEDEDEEEKRKKRKGYGTPDSTDDEDVDPEDFYYMLGEISDDDDDDGAEDY